MYVQAGLAAVTGRGLLAFAERRRRSSARPILDGHLIGHPGLLSLMLLFAAAALVVIGVGVHRDLAWANPAAYLAEASVGFGSMILFHFHPARSFVGLALAAVVVLLIATDRTTSDPPMEPGNLGWGPDDREDESDPHPADDGAESRP